jgi:hypothetical protein
MGNVLDTTYICVDDLKVTSIPTSIGNDFAIDRLQEFRLHQNYPNPFNPITTINFVLRNSSDVNLTVYDINGKSIRSLVSGKLTAGEKSVNWDATDHLGNKVTSGVYFYTLKTPTWSETKKMILIK